MPVIITITNEPIAIDSSDKFLIHAGLRDVNNNSIIQHNKNTNIGFYYYSAF